MHSVEPGTLLVPENTKDSASDTGSGLCLLTLCWHRKSLRGSGLFSLFLLDLQVSVCGWVGGSGEMSSGV